MKLSELELALAKYAGDKSRRVVMDANGDGNYIEVEGGILADDKATGRRILILTPMKLDRVGGF